MAYVPGLIPTQGDPEQTPDKLGGRVPTDDRIPQAPALRPVAAPVNTYARPPAFTDPGLQRLADSLGQLSSSIFAFGDATSEADKQMKPGVVTQKLAGRTPDEQKQILADDPALHGAVAERFAHGIIGSTSADQDANALRTAYSTQFDRDNGNFDRFVNGYVRNVLDKEKDPTFARSYMERMQPTIDALRGEHAKYLAERTVTDQNNLIYGKFQSTVNEAMERGASPEVALGAIRQTMGAIDTVARRTPAEQEQILVQMLGRQVEALKDAPDYDKRFQMLQGILNAKSVDPRTGQERSLMDDQIVGAKAHEIMGQAATIFSHRDEALKLDTEDRVFKLARTADPSFAAARDAFAKEHPRWADPSKLERWNHEFFSADQRIKKEAADRMRQVQEDTQKNAILSGVLESFAKGAGFDVKPQTYTDKDGTPGHVYTVEDQRKDAAEIAQRMIDQKYAGWKTDPQKAQQKLAEEVSLYGQNGLRNKDWETQLKNGPAAATTVTSAGGDITPALQQSYQLYRDLRAASPELLQKHLDERSQRFFEVARVAQEMGMGADAKQALALAARAANEGKLESIGSGQSTRDTVDQAKRQLTGFMGFGGLATATNADEVIRKVVATATVYREALGLPMDKAIEQAAPGVKASYVKINGNAVFVGDRYVPRNFEDLANQYVDRYWEQNKEALTKQHFSKGDLILFSANGTSNWSIILRGYPHVAPDTAGAMFSLHDLYRIQDNNQQRSDDEAMKAGWRTYDHLHTKQPPPRGIDEGRRPAGGDYLPRRPNK
ncbi:MAG: hypothetical protein LWW93_16670 [Hyphomicrobiales bacterium]|nr:hypothetical protein [Hyphomicrobiales bacterium]